MRLLITRALVNDACAYQYHTRLSIRRAHINVTVVRSSIRRAFAIPHAPISNSCAYQQLVPLSIK